MIYETFQFPGFGAQRRRRKEDLLHSLGVSQLPSDLPPGCHPDALHVLLQQGGRPAVRPMVRTALLRRPLREAAEARLRTPVLDTLPPGPVSAVSKGKIRLSFALPPYYYSTQVGLRW